MGRVPSARGAAGAVARGFALPAALLALLVIAALAAGAFFGAHQELRAGRNGREAEAAFDAAEAGLARALGEGRTGAWGALAAGDSLVMSAGLPGGTGLYEVTVLRLNGQLYLIRSSGSAAGFGAARTVALLVRGADRTASFAAALTASGGVEIGAATFLDGRDTPPPGWVGCEAVGVDTVAGLAVRSAGDLVTAPSCAGWSCLAGEPRLLSDTAIRDSAVLRVGSLGWEDIARLAGREYAATAGGTIVAPGPVGAGPLCDRSVPENWGEPARPPVVAACQGYFPVILIHGDLTLMGGRGQGVLLVEGDLTVTGGAEYAGLVLVGGSVRSSGAGGRVLGAVAAGGRGGGVAARLEGASMAFSGCALAAALAGIGPVHPLSERSWAYLY